MNDLLKGVDVHFKLSELAISFQQLYVPEVMTDG